MTKLLKTILIFAVMVLIQGCVEQPLKPDPCKEKSTTSADFTIMEIIKGIAFETDAIVSNSNVKFVSKHKLDSLYWKIGDDARVFRDSIVTLNLFPEGQTIPVVLVGKREADTLCFPFDNGIDTVKKVFKVYDYFDSPVIGKYVGKNYSTINNIEKIDTITIYKYEEYNQFPRVYLKVYSLRCDTKNGPSPTLGGSTFIYDNDFTTGRNSCWELNGIGHYSSGDNSLVFNYSVKDSITNSTLINYTFTGIKTF